MGALEGSRDLESGQVACRAVPIPGPTAEPGDRVSMADQVPPAAMADQVPPAAMANQGAWDASPKIFLR